MSRGAGRIKKEYLIHARSEKGVREAEIDQLKIKVAEKEGSISVLEKDVAAAQKFKDARDKLKAGRKEATRRETCPGKLEAAEKDLKKTRENLNSLHAHASEVYQSIVGVLPDKFEDESGERVGVEEACKENPAFMEFEKEFKPIDLDGIYGKADALVADEKDEDIGIRTWLIFR
jgi:cell division septum initiation protein DivIVA